MATIKLEVRRWGGSDQSSARWLWECKRGWLRLGPVAALGLLCALLALGAWWQTRQGVQQQKQLQEKIAQEKLAQSQARAQSKVGPSADELDLARQLAAFYTFLPAHNSLPDKVRQLLVQAQKSGVTPSQAEYKVVPELNAAFLRYQIILPVKAEPRPIQNFIAAALHGLPSLTLESVSFKRERSDSTQIEARIQFQLLIKKATAKNGIAAAPTAAATATSPSAAAPKEANHE
jgi:hypothetical protein